MKKYLYSLTIFSCATITYNSFTMMHKLLITKKSSQKIQRIESDYQKLHALMQRKSKETAYKKPSDLVDDLLRDKTISISHMPPISLIFLKEDVQFLDQRFNTLAPEYGTNYAWQNILFLMNTKMENTCYSLQDREIMHSAALVSLKQEQRLPKKYNTFLNFFGELEDTAEIDIKHWEQTERKAMLENIEHHKNILAKE